MSDDDLHLALSKGFWPRLIAIVVACFCLGLLVGALGGMP